MSYMLTGYLANCVETWHLSAHPARLLLWLTEHRLSALPLTAATRSAGNLPHSQQSTCALLRRGTRRSQRGVLRPPSLPSVAPHPASVPAPKTLRFP